MTFQGKILLIAGCAENLGVVITSLELGSDANLTLHDNFSKIKEDADKIEAVLILLNIPTLRFNGISRPYPPRANHSNMSFMSGLK